MKRFAAVTLAALMVLAVFASSASAADTAVIRGPVYNGTSLEDILDSTTVFMDAENFAAFYYDLDEGTFTESLSIESATENTIDEDDGLIYRTEITEVDFEFDNGFDGVEQYPVLGFFAEPYIPLDATSPDKLAKLIMDDDEKYTLRTGEILDLGEGYALEAKQVDVEGDKVWLEFTKDGEFVDDEIIDVATAGNDWIVDLDDIEDEDDVIVLRVHVNQVFQGAVDSIAQIEGLWLIDYANAMTIESDDEFGNLDDVSIDGATLTITNEDTFTLTRDSEEEIGEGMYLKIADTPSSELRYYPYVEKTIEGEGVEEEVTETEEEVTETEEEVTETEEEVTETEEEVTETEEEVTETEEEAEGEEEGAPGFGFVFGLVGLLAVVYLVRRNN